MTEHTYTDADLRAEAALQHKAATEDLSFSGVSEQMEGHKIPSRGGFQWDQLEDADFDKAQRSVDTLLEEAADVSRWAVDLGADDLEPDEHQFTLSAGPVPLIRVHFGFASGLSDDGRNAFVQGLGEAAAREMQLALQESTEVTIPMETAAHVLFTERKGGWPPSTFAAKLLDTWTSADTDNAEHLADAFPEYAAAIALVRSGEQGVRQLRLICGDF